MKTLLAVALAVLLASVAVAEDASDDANFEPVRPEKLIKLLPGGTKDFKAGKADGRMSAELGSKLTMVTRVYTYRPGDNELDDNEPKRTLSIKISDTTASKSFPALHGKLAEMGQNQTSGFSNAISIDGHLAIQNYREKDQVGLMSLYVADRFLVQLAVRGLPKDTMMEWWQKIDDDKLAALAIPPTPTPAPTPSHTPAESQTPASSS